ncbi:MAG TPA: sulfite exporter TauE/SafE family protein [Acidimicrobiales bacterium]|nr:sulfite exporter TauE/SafE family protein [Acidimicrobiales bacterium]
MTPLGFLALAAAGVAAGAVNTIAGAGSLLTFPLMIALGLSPLSANVTNDLGVLPGNVSGAVGFRHELSGQAPRLRALLPIAGVGSLIGAVLLLSFPARTFEQVAPFLLLVASLVTAAQPALARLAQQSRRPRHHPLRLVVAAIAVYGGYFGTGIGILFFAALGVFVDDTASRLNATKQTLQLVSNGVAGVLFAFVAPVHWAFALVLAVSTAVGGPLGARLSRRISATALRAVICTVGVAAAAVLEIRLH